MDKIKLTGPHASAAYCYLETAGTPSETAWTETDYSDLQYSGPEAIETCVVCDEAILGRHFMCLDGGDSAHIDCVEVSNAS